MRINLFMFFFFSCYGYHRDLHVLTHSFPTRRSSDLAIAVSQRIKEGNKERLQVFEGDVIAMSNNHASSTFTVRKIGANGVAVERRSEEHTSELQSLMRISYAVFFLKKKKNE